MEIKTDLIPPQILKNLLFLPTWVEPPSFLTMTAKSRRKLINNYTLQSLKDPTKDCFWVWFGQYNTETHNAVHNGPSVQRLLYRLYIDNNLPDKKRLSNHMTATYSDVNPFKAACGTLGYLNHINLRKVKNPLMAPDDVSVDKCVKYIQENGFEKFPPADIRMYMVGDGFTPLVIEEALSKLKLIP